MPQSKPYKWSQISIIVFLLIIMIIMSLHFKEMKKKQSTPKIKKKSSKPEW